MIITSAALKQLIMVELTVSWEERKEEANERKRAKYQLLLENHLFIKLEKSTFHVQTIFLGFVVSHNALCLDPAKVQAVENWPRPTSLRLVQTFTIGS
ncbi:hypothetical protein P4O66_011063 [Electrophorus voltai]|uniref:Uncharacterized protein n=1 Tax=Electrophorus voltai TaxID=2609070 RepID=A0AAD8ZA09_9TELE|nr:hypothetical protein P4O66_011063 [Electrophorus voltai]